MGASRLFFVSAGPKTTFQETRSKSSGPETDSTRERLRNPLDFDVVSFHVASRRQTKETRPYRHNIEDNIEHRVENSAEKAPDTTF